MYTVLVGRPGLGKGTALNPIAALLREANTTSMLSDRVTIEYVLEKLAKGFPAQVQQVGGGLSFGQDSSLTIFSPELSIFITSSQHTLQILTDLWDSREGDFLYGTRHKGDYKIKNPCVSLLAGSTQEWLVSSIPTNAVGGGFTRRVNFVFAKDRQASIPWPVSNHSNIKDGLINDLRHVAQLRGSFRFDKHAHDLFEEYYNDQKIGEFDDEATAGYKATKWAHASKLAMCLSVAERDDLVISESNLVESIDRVEGVLASLSVVFRAVGESDLVEAADRVLRFVEIKGFASRSDILRSNWRHVSSADLDTILATFVQGGLMFERVSGNKISYEVNPAHSSKTAFNTNTKGRTATP